MFDEDDDCDVCGGDGYIHDCGDDSCCCKFPDEDDCFVCEACDGDGHVCRVDSEGEGQ